MDTNQRKTAAEMFATGATRAQVAQQLGVSPTTAGKWYTIWNSGGIEDLTRHRRPGRRTAISDEHLLLVQRALADGARANGFDGDEWSLDSIVAMIVRLTGRAYNPRHITRLLRQHGWVVPPVGAAAHARMRADDRLADPDQNRIVLYQ